MVRSIISCFKRRLIFLWVVPVLLPAMYQTFAFGGFAPVEKTGQVTSYSTTGGEDGDLKKGVKWPSPRFRDNGNGTVKDNLTRLIWLKNANAFGQRTWEQALSDANTLSSGLAGLTDGSVAGDWRLPNVKELQSLVDFAFTDPALSDESGKHKWKEGHPFFDVQSYHYWSSTTHSYTVALAWNVYMNDGYVTADYKTIGYHVWPVRAGK